MNQQDDFVEYIVRLSNQLRRSRYVESRERVAKLQFYVDKAKELRRKRDSLLIGTEINSVYREIEELSGIPMPSVVNNEIIESPLLEEYRIKRKDAEIILSLQTKELLEKFWSLPVDSNERRRVWAQFPLYETVIV